MKLFVNFFAVFVVFSLFVAVSESRAEKCRLDIGAFAFRSSITSALTESYANPKFSFALSTDGVGTTRNDDSLVYAQIRMNTTDMREYCVPYSLLDKFCLDNHISFVSGIEIAPFGKEWQVKRKEGTHILGMLRY